VTAEQRILNWIRRADFDDTGCRHSQGTIAKALGYSREHVNRCTRKLAADGRLRIAKERRPGCQWPCNVYYVETWNPHKRSGVLNVLASICEARQAQCHTERTAKPSRAQTTPGPLSSPQCQNYKRCGCARVTRSRCVCKDCEANEDNRKEHRIMSTTVIQERIDAIIGVPLCSGPGTRPPEGEVPCDLCVMEMYAWITGQEWTDDPENCSELIGAFMRRYNDCTDQAGRDELAQWVIANVERLAATADDGRDRERGYIMADWAVRTAVPAWLDLAGSMDAAQRVRELPVIVDDKTAWQGRALMSEVRKGLPDWWTWRTELREKVRAAVREALKNGPAAADATAATAAAAATATTARGGGTSTSRAASRVVANGNCTHSDTSFRSPGLSAIEELRRVRIACAFGAADECRRGSQIRNCL